MARLTEKEIATRLGYDYRVAHEAIARLDNIEVEAYRNHRDAKARKRKITDQGEAHQAAHYIVTYRIPTLSGAGKFSDQTVIHIDLLANGNYPFTPPASWVISDPMPWSPHFRAGTVVCIGDIWNAGGTTLLAHLMRHHARLLNWHEVARGGGYRGWNGQAIDWHKEKYGSSPLNEQMIYPQIPSTTGYGLEEPGNAFSVSGRSGSGGRRRTVSTPTQAPGDFVTLRGRR